MLKALLWKEWHEQRSRMALATVWLVGMTAIGLKTRISSDRGILEAIWVSTAFVLPLFVGMGLFASERNAGTFAYLVVQPVERGKVLAAKVIMGLLAYAVPLIASGTAACLTVSGREMSLASLIGLVASVIAFGLILFAWQLLAGLTCRREETYVLTGLGTLAAWFLYALIWNAFDPPGRLGHWLVTAMPVAIMKLPDWPRRPDNLRDVVVMQGLIVAGLSLGLWLRFRRLREGKS